jgi:hypothetical protein
MHFFAVATSNRQQAMSAIAPCIFLFLLFNKKKKANRTNFSNYCVNMSQGASNASGYMAGASRKRADALL